MATRVLRYRRKTIDSDTVEKYLSDKKLKLQEAKSTQTHQKDTSSYQVKTKVPYAWKPAWLRFEQATIATTAGGKSRRHIFSLLINQCEKKSSCKKAEADTDEKSLKLSHWEFLPKGITVARVYFGDVNKDGKSDILLKFSSGAGYLFQSTSESKKTVPPANDF